jgi:hypothetical protein
MEQQMIKLKHTAVLAALVLLSPMTALAQSGQSDAQPVTAQEETLANYFLPVRIDGEEVGDVVDLVFKDGRIAGVVLEVERYLGTGARRVAVSIDRLTKTQDTFTTDMTREELQALPDLSRPDDEDEMQGHEPKQ